MEPIAGCANSVFVMFFSKMALSSSVNTGFGYILFAKSYPFLVSKSAIVCCIVSKLLVASFAIFTYWEPWPENNEATLIVLEIPFGLKKIPFGCDQASLLFSNCTTAISNLEMQSIKDSATKPKRASFCFAVPSLDVSFKL